jgi:carotenoid cleavage dioxygenase
VGAGLVERAGLLVLDAYDLAKRPVAAFDLPQRVPAGIHGHRIPETPTQ